MVKKWLYFRSIAGDTDDTSADDSVCYPASSLVGMSPASRTTIVLRFRPLTRGTPPPSVLHTDNLDNNDTVTLTVTTETQATTMKAITNAIVGENFPSFLVIANDDSDAPEYLAGSTITSCTIGTKADYSDNSGDGNVGIGTASPDTKLEVVGSFAANGPSSTFVTMSSGDTSPDVSGGNIFKSHADGVTIDQFDGGICGQIITIISGGATVYDVTSSELKGGTTNITTAAGDVTMWVCESATVWHLISWMDLSIDLSSGGF